MNIVTLTPDFEIVIPEEVRERLGLEAGQELQVLVYGQRIELIAIREIQSLRGFLRGIDTDFPREPDRV